MGLRLVVFGVSSVGPPSCGHRSELHRAPVLRLWSEILGPPSFGCGVSSFGPPSWVIDLVPRSRKQSSRTTPTPGRTEAALADQGLSDSEVVFPVNSPQLGVPISTEGTVPTGTLSAGTRTIPSANRSLDPTISALFTPTLNLDPGVSLRPWRLALIELPLVARGRRRTRHQETQTEGRLTDRGTQTSPVEASIQITRVSISIQTETPTLSPECEDISTPEGLLTPGRKQRRRDQRKRRKLVELFGDTLSSTSDEEPPPNRAH